MVNDRCQYEFEWSNDRTSEVGKYGSISRSNNPEGETVVTFEIDGKSLREHRCIRETVENSDYCAWHSLRCPNKSGYELPEEEKWNVIADAKFTNCGDVDQDLSFTSFFWPDFTGSTISSANFDQSILYFADFTDSTIKDADFNNTLLNFGSFNQSEIGLEYATAGSVKFKRADCQGANFKNAQFGDNVEFSDAKFDRSTSFADEMENLSFRGADLSDVNIANTALNGSDFSNTQLSRAEFDNVEFRNANFSNSMAFDSMFTNECDLERANFQGANLQGVSFNNSLIHSTIFNNAVIDHETDFDNICYYENQAEKTDDIERKLENLDRAIWVYQNLSDINRANSQSKMARSYYVKMKDTIRKKYWVELCGVDSPKYHLRGLGKYLSRTLSILTKTQIPEDRVQSVKFRVRLWNVIKSQISKWVIGYGESWKNILFSLGIIAFFYSVAYQHTELNTGDSSIIPESILGVISIPGFLQQWLLSMYFSVVTFTTLGYGDISPVGLAAYIAASEAVIGSSLLALLVFVLGRRATW